jgi:hypothetical protein
MKELSELSATELFSSTLQHIKCIEVRLECAKATTTQKQKQTLNNALLKVKSALNHICDLLPNSDAVIEVKRELERPDLVYVMLIMEQILKIPTDDMEDIVELIENYINTKYGEVTEV